MKCYCGEEIVKYFTLSKCMNPKCDFYKCSIIHEFNDLFYISVNIDKNNKGYGFISNINPYSSVFSKHKKDIVITKDLFIDLVNKTSIIEVKQIYDNYSLFI